MKLVRGQVYRLYTHDMNIPQGQTAEFIMKQSLHCQHHGELIGKVFAFVKVKKSGRRSYRFDVPVENLDKAELVEAP